MEGPRVQAARQGSHDMGGDPDAQVTALVRSIPWMEVARLIQELFVHIVLSHHFQLYFV